MKAFNKIIINDGVKVTLIDNNIYVIILNIYIIKVNITEIFDKVIIKAIFIKSFKLKLSIFNKFKGFLIFNL